MNVEGFSGDHESLQTIGPFGIGTIVVDHGDDSGGHFDFESRGEVGGAPSRDGEVLGRSDVVAVAPLLAEWQGPGVGVAVGG